MWVFHLLPFFQVPLPLWLLTLFITTVESMIFSSGLAGFGTKQMLQVLVNRISISVRWVFFLATQINLVLDKFYKWNADVSAAEFLILKMALKM